MNLVAHHHLPSSTRSMSYLETHDRPANEDNPYFVCSIDHPGLILVTPPLLDHNFQQWHRDFNLALDSKNMTGFIDGILRQPALSSPFPTTDRAQPPKGPTAYQAFTSLDVSEKLASLQEMISQFITQ
ncbi:hypothetical protein F8388_019507 [Cannabis sativa]|uniref:Retrotransposon Copia-like N-terminal domain-containing protein n=1 Tax=Cannabis sativa TaxID=3483 RepID=A0A7J6EEE9_CANSA|nr:hypothetical protein F8388_019507 [Cannabis sativa]KAF4402669.1 hypothetical protein G4B88_012454 [Cannabis sativa]